MFYGPRAKKYAPCGTLSIGGEVEMKDVDLPLVLAVLGDRSFQNLILGILQREMLATRII